MRPAWLIGIAIVLAALYFAGLVGYRLLLSLRSLQSEQQKLQVNLKQLEEPIEREFSKATPSNSQPAAQVLAKRKHFLDAKERRAAERRRRLVERLQTLDLDKR